MFRTLRSRLLAATLSILLLAFGLFSWFGFHWLKESLIRAQEIRTVLLGETIKRGLMVTMLMGKGKEIQQVIEAMAQHEEIEVIRIFDTKGSIRKSSRRSEIGLPVPAQSVDRGLRQERPEVFQEADDGQPTLTLFQRVDNLPACHRCHGSDHAVRGILELRVSLAGVLAEVANQQKRLIWTGLGTFLFLSVGLWFTLSKGVTRPVENLSEAMKQAEQGNLSARAPERGAEEIAHLGKAFNATISALSEARRQAEEAHKAELLHMDRLASIGELASGIAHEIKNPLAGIAGAAEVIRDQLPQSDPKRQVLDTILADVGRLHRSIEGILNYVRITPSRLVPTRLDDIVHKVLLLISPQVRSKGIEVHKEWPEDLPPLLADSEKIQQVVLNLVLNAVQVMAPPPATGPFRAEDPAERRGVAGGGVEPGGRITLSARSLPPGRIEIFVRDTGPGIPPDRHARIFEPFYSTRKGGTGLGLAICKRIMEDHGGSIDVESEPGQGTTFKLVLKSA